MPSLGHLPIPWMCKHLGSDQHQRKGAISPRLGEPGHSILLLPGTFEPLALLCSWNRVIMSRCSRLAHRGMKNVCTTHTLLVWAGSHHMVAWASRGLGDWDGQCPYGVQVVSVQEAVTRWSPAGEQGPVPAHKKVISPASCGWGGHSQGSVSALFFWIIMQSCSTSWGALSRKVSRRRNMLTSAYSYIIAQ